MKRTDWRDILLYLLVLASAFMASFVVGAMLGSCVYGAPAPLPRRAPARPLAPPVCCTMVWCGVEYRTTFAPGGSYEARGPEAVWVGSWKVEGRTLVIVESQTPECAHSWMIYRVEMDGRLREGRTETGGEVRLEGR